MASEEFVDGLIKGPFKEEGRVQRNHRNNVVSRASNTEAILTPRSEGPRGWNRRTMTRIQRQNKLYEENHWTGAAAPGEDPAGWELGMSTPVSFSFLLPSPVGVLH